MAGYVRAIQPGRELDQASVVVERAAARGAVGVRDVHVIWGEREHLETRIGIRAAYEAWRPACDVRKDFHPVQAQPSGSLGDARVIVVAEQPCAGADGAAAVIVDIVLQIQRACSSLGLAGIGDDDLPGERAGAGRG